ncbi:MAG: Nif11-like leader peptide family natural product precursor [Schwartzia sp.]|jgi:predicted ribosomally synthesized peptide with nif11-like leader|nr:Nif11-like leader peptide family natural product precursor [Schwartzia sp. (in: firmicutes)]
MAKQLKREELTKEMVKKALRCKDADELLALAKSEGYEMTREEAEAYMAEINDFQLDDEAMKAVAGGVKTCYMVDGCAFKCGTLKDC